MEGKEHVQRIAWAIKIIKKDKNLDHGITDANLAKIFKVEKAAMVRYKKGRQSTVKSTVLGALIIHYKFNPYWIFEGKGEPFPGAREKYPDVCGPMTNDEMWSSKSENKNMDFVTVRYIECMNGIKSVENGDNNAYAMLAFRRKWILKMGKPEEFIAFRNSGDGMQPTICPGDILLVNTGLKKVSSQGGIYVLKDVNGFAVRRIQAEIGSKNLKLICDNKIYEPTITAAETINIYGKAVWVGGRIDV